MINEHQAYYKYNEVLFLQCYFRIVRVQVGGQTNFRTDENSNNTNTNV